MAIDIYVSSPLDAFEPEEEKLFNLVNQYRAENGLPAIFSANKPQIPVRPRPFRQNLNA